MDFSKEIDDFVGWNRDLQALELDADDWSAISQVASWLKAFRSATTEMSWAKEPMLSTMHAIFHGLQDHICLTLTELPDSAPIQLRDSLLEAHKKLSEYNYWSDESPYYTGLQVSSLAHFLVIWANFILLQFLTLRSCMKASKATANQTQC